jgi:hypothetical protein
MRMACMSPCVPSSDHHQLVAHRRSYHCCECCQWADWPPLAHRSCLTMRSIVLCSCNTRSDEKRFGTIRALGSTLANRFPDCIKKQHDEILCDAHWQQLRRRMWQDSAAVVQCGSTSFTSSLPGPVGTGCSLLLILHFTNILFK